MTEAAGVHDLDDRELVRLALAGQQAAAAELVRRYQDRVFNTCYRMCHNYADALDLTQSTFLKALENLGRFHGGAAFYTWLFRIAVNLTLSQPRSHSRRPHQSLDGYREEGPVGNVSGREADPATAAEGQEMQRRVEWALEQLEDEFRLAVILRDIEDLDYAAIGEILGVPVGTVKSRIHRGRQMLRVLLKDVRAHVD